MSIDGISSNFGTAQLMIGAIQGMQSEEFSKLLEASVAGEPQSGGGLDEIFIRAAEAYGISENLLKAVAKAESNFNPEDLSSAGAAGIMQLMPATAKELGVGDVFDPEENIMGGAKLLSRLLKRYGGGLELALAAYNAGPGNVDKYGGVPPFSETRAYVKRVLEYMQSPIDTSNVSLSSSKGGAISEAEGGDAFKELMQEHLIMSLLMDKPTLRGSEDRKYSF